MVTGHLDSMSPTASTRAPGANDNGSGVAVLLELARAFEAAQLKSDLPRIYVGDTVRVGVRIKEGNKERVQPYEGVVIAKRNRGINSAFTVRKISHGEGVERVFQTYSPSVADIKLKRRGDVRRAKLYYLRGRTGKAARIREKL